MKKKINETVNSSADIVKAFADIITDAHPTTAEFVARELYMHGAGKAMAFIINHDNGYGYTDAEEVEFDDNSMNESTSRAAKRIIRINESELKNIINEVMRRELSI